MEDQSESNKKRRNIFLSYSHDDEKIAQKIIKKFKENDFIAINSLDLVPGDIIDKTIKNAISSSDYVLLLISKNSYKSNWFSNELNKTFLNDLKYRNISLIPVLIDKSSIPQIISNYQYFDLTKNEDVTIDKLIAQFEYVPKIDFSKLSPETFIDLIIDLLKVLKFKNFESEYEKGSDIGYDFKAELVNKDPFGKKTIETWLIEIKYYNQERVSPQTIDFFRQLLQNNKQGLKGLLITNSQLTSIVLNQLEHYSKFEHFHLRVIDGIELKKILLNHKSLIRKYFNNLGCDLE